MNARNNRRTQRQKLVLLSIDTFRIEDPNEIVYKSDGAIKRLCIIRIFNLMLEMGCASTIEHEKTVDQHFKTPIEESCHSSEGVFVFKENDEGCPNADTEQNKQLGIEVRPELALCDKQNTKEFEDSEGGLNGPGKQAIPIKDPAVSIEPEEDASRIFPKPILIEKSSNSTAKRRIKTKGKERLTQPKLVDNQLDDGYESTEDQEFEEETQNRVIGHHEIKIDNMSVSLGDEFDL